MFINWCDYISPGYPPYSSALQLNHELSALPYGNTEAQAIARAEVSEQCAEFITFLKCTEQLALVQAGMQRNPISRSRLPLRYSVFLPDQLLHSLLAHAEVPRCTESCRYQQTIPRLAALMTINIAIWEYRHSPDLCEQFFLELVENVARGGLARHVSSEAVVQTLLSGSKYSSLQNTERPWFVGRMLQIAKRLSRPSFDRLKKLLFSFMTLESDLKPTMENWQNDLRREIQCSPLVSCYSRFAPRA
ncbi:hypothetical protein PV08_06046 [Exophiala spinifera]|uniref:Uncharacterized protein n=1 Tax=Exophiala spinifera TaxID=91928 RepID=A0A0D2BBN5_9EURO|nr:uncharacterized protein PV08_06046 [Exophiala spinifera]KIW15995.1 hypothetical protein PV08_06046 [Exophiala spinifera]